MLYILYFYVYILLILLNGGIQYTVVLNTVHILLYSLAENPGILTACL